MLEGFITNDLELLIRFEEGILKILDTHEDTDCNIFLKELEYLFDEIENNEKKLEIVSAVLHLIAELSMHRQFSRKEKIYLQKTFSLINSKCDIKSNFTQYMLYNIYKDSYSFLLFLYQEQFVDMEMLKRQNDIKMQLLTIPETNIIFDNGLETNVISQNLQDFKEKRFEEHSDDYVAEVIRCDELDIFLDLILTTNLDVNSTIQYSLFEVNNDLDFGKVTLIEYAAYFSSIKIFKYLWKNVVFLPDMLSIFSIYGGNIEIIQILEDKGIEFGGKCLEASIKAHRSEITEYIVQNYQVVESGFFIIGICIEYRNYISLGHIFEGILAECDLCNLFSISYEHTFLPLFSYLFKTSKIISLNNDDDPLILRAVKDNKDEIVGFLINQSCIDINSTDEWFLFIKLNYLIGVFKNN